MTPSLSAGPTLREKGVKFGCKPKLTAHQQQEARKRIEAGETVAVNVVGLFRMGLSRAPI